MPLMELPEVEKDLWGQWKQNPVTKRAIAGLLNRREEIKEGIVEDGFSNEEERLKAIGRAQALKDAVLYMIEDFDYLIKEDTTDVSVETV